MRFGQLMEYNKRNIFFISYAENEAGRLVPDVFLFFRKALYDEKVNKWSVVILVPISLDSHQLSMQKKTNFKNKFCLIKHTCS